jgi:hypothetical protein
LHCNARKMCRPYPDHSLSSFIRPESAGKMMG